MPLVILLLISIGGYGALQWWLAPLARKHARADVSFKSFGRIISQKLVFGQPCRSGWELSLRYPFANMTLGLVTGKRLKFSIEKPPSLSKNDRPFSQRKFRHQRLLVISV